MSALAPEWRTERWEECPTCAGTKSDRCDKCRGEGLLHGGAVECDRCDGVGLVDCPDCDATGGPVFVEVAPDGSVGRVARAGASS